MKLSHILSKQKSQSFFENAIINMIRFQLESASNEPKEDLTAELPHDNLLKIHNSFGFNWVWLIPIRVFVGSKVA